ncbi:MAG: hypothetical protein WC730_02340 [Patescibacteria group bacterium]|jgi:hypothetical protein
MPQSSGPSNGRLTQGRARELATQIICCTHEYVGKSITLLINDARVNATVLRIEGDDERSIVIHAQDEKGNAHKAVLPISGEHRIPSGHVEVVSLEF